jgi:hypothetical protein
MSPDVASDPIVQELCSLDAEIVSLPSKYSPGAVAEPSVAHVWELAALWFFNSNRIHEALRLFWRLYQQMVAGQGGGRINKGMPLVWMSDCYERLGFAVTLSVISC